MAFKMKNTAYYKKKFTESEMASPYNKSSFTDNFTSASKQLDAALESGRMSKAEYNAAMASLEKSAFGNNNDNNNNDDNNPDKEINTFQGEYNEGGWN